MNGAFLMLDPSPKAIEKNFTKHGMNTEDQSKIKIIFLINSLEGGGAERVLSILANNLFPCFDISLLLLDDKSRAYEIHPGINVTILNGGNFILSSLHLAIFIKRNNQNAVVSFLNRSNYVNILSNIIFKHKTIISERNIPSLHFYGKGIYGFLNTKLIRYLYQFTDKVISVSKGVEDDLVRNFYIDNRKIVTINNPLDIEKIESSSWDEVCIDNYFCAAGRLNNQKCFDFLISSFHKSNTGLDLLILGEGEERKKLESLIRKLDLSSRVHLIGHQPNPYKYFRKAKFFVLASAYEGLPNVLLEAMALGKAVISTDCQFGPKEILAPGMEEKIDSVCLARYGILTPVADENLMASAIDTLSNNDALRSSYELSAKERAKDFCLSNIVQRYREELLKEL